MWVLRLMEEMLHLTKYENTVFWKIRYFYQAQLVFSGFLNHQQHDEYDDFGIEFAF